MIPRRAANGATLSRIVIERNTNESTLPKSEQSYLSGISWQTPALIGQPFRARELVGRINRRLLAVDQR